MSVTFTAVCICCFRLVAVHAQTHFEFIQEHKHHPILCGCIASGLWVGDCFIYNNSAWRLNYCVGGEVTTMYHLDRPMYLLGYLASHSKVYLIDKVCF